MSLLDAALDLARQGVPVFPCGTDKSPRVAGGFKRATADGRAILDWGELWDGAMIGAAITPGLIVVDIDPRNGGDKTVEALKAAGHELPPTRFVRTQSGGTHRYYTVPEEIELRKELGPGIDVQRAGKAYVIVPPSPGYELIGTAKAAPAPDWLVEELQVEARAAHTSEPSDPKFWERFEKGTSYGLAAMERELGRLATQTEGGRNHALNRSAFALAQLAAGGELDEAHARAELERVALLIGLEPEESRKTIESGWTAGEADPRQAPTIDAEREEPTVLAVDPESGDPEAEGRFWTDWDVDEPEPPFYLHPLLPKNAYVLVYGATEAAKSMAWVGLLSQGSHHGVRSSVYSLENPPHTDRSRLRRWAPNPDNFRLTNQPLDVNDPRQLEALARREATWGADVILIDTYSHAFHSRSDDGNAKAIEFARRMRWLMAQVGCSVVLIDHTGFEGDEPRDASAKRQQSDVAVLMKKVGEWELGHDARFSMLNRKAARFANPFFLTGAISDAKGGGLEIVWGRDAPRWNPAP